MLSKPSPFIPFLIVFGIAVLVHARGGESMDAYLERWGQEIDTEALANRWQEQCDHYSFIGMNWQTFATTLEARYDKILQAQLKELWPEQDLRLNPWGAVDQETNFTPPFDQVRFPFGPVIENYGGKETKQRIPGLFRLAELLHIGTNELKLEASRIDPSFHTHHPQEYAIVSRARNDLIGTFRVDEGAIEIETLRLSVESRLPTGYAILRMGPELPLRKFGIQYIDFRKDYSQNGYGRRAWDRQQLGSLVTEHAIEILPSQAQRRERNEAIIELRRNVTSNLKAHQNSLLQRLGSTISTKVTSLKNEIESLKNWERASINLTESHHWSTELISPSDALDAMMSQEIKTSPSEFITQLAQSQSQLALQALLNGLRRQLPEPSQASANERYLAFIIESRTENQTNSNGDPCAQSDR